jgi:hypothetical protein
MISIWSYIQSNTGEASVIALSFVVVLYVLGKVVKHYWLVHEESVKKIDTLEGAIVDKDNKHIYTRAETHEKLDHVYERIQYLTKLLEERCENSCPLNRSMENLHGDNKDLQETIKEIAYDLRKTSYELLSLTRTLIDRFSIK